MAKKGMTPKPLIELSQIIELPPSSLLAVNGHFEKTRKRMNRGKIQSSAALPAENRPPIRIAFSKERPIACLGLVDGAHSLAAACDNGEPMVVCEIINIDHRPKLREKLAKRNIAHDRDLTPEEKVRPVTLRMMHAVADQAGQTTGAIEKITFFLNNISHHGFDKSAALRKLLVLWFR